MLHIKAGHSKNPQIILQLFGYNIFCKNLQHKKISSKFRGIRGINRSCTNGGKARVMSHIGAGDSNNCQKIFKLFGYDIFCNNLKQKNYSKFEGIRGINHLHYK